MFGQLRVVDDAGPARRDDGGARLVAAVKVSGTTNILAAVLRVHPPEHHRHITEIVYRREAILCKQFSFKLWPVTKIHNHGEIK